MSQSHLRQLHAALIQRGWKVFEKLRGDVDVQGAASWEIQRSERGPVLRIDFEGFGAMGEDLSLEKSYGCQVRGHSIQLYFSRVNRNHERWVEDLATFINSLEGAIERCM